MLQDAARAIRTVRARAGEWGLDPNRIGILGFSPEATLPQPPVHTLILGIPSAEDPIERVSSRPDLTVLVHPVISFSEFAHVGSRKNLIGENAPSELVELLSNEQQVTAETPPAFLIHTPGGHRSALGE